MDEKVGTDGTLFWLPSELRHKIYRFCNKDDLINLTVCSKQCHIDVLPVLWQEVEIQWKTLARITPILGKRCFENMRLISQLRIYGFISELNKGYLALGFSLFLRDCNCKQMKTLTIAHHIPPAGIRFVSEMFPNLQRLELNYCGRDPDRDLLSQFPKLSSLTLCSDSSLKDWRDICKMESLRRLGFTRNTKISNLQLADVDFKLVNLVHLNLSNTHAGDKLLALISSNCRELKYLDLSATKLTDLGLSCISHLLSLKYLDLQECIGITNSGIFFLSPLRVLDHLGLYSAGVTFACLKNVSKLSTLTYLDIGDLGEATDENFEHVTNLVALQNLVLYEVPDLSDASLEVISRLQCLESLEVSESPNLTAAGLAHLKKLPRLKSLDLDSYLETEIKSGGVDFDDLLKVLV